MKFGKYLTSTPENINDFVKNNTDGILDFFNNNKIKVKKVNTKILFKNSFTSLKFHLQAGAYSILENLHKPKRLIDIVNYDKNNKAYNFSDDTSNDKQFNGAKLHWLVNDIKISGLSYPPQGYMQHKGYVCHPGTYRFLAAFAQQIESQVSVWDTYQEFDSEPLDLIDWLNFCSNGFVRKHRIITIELDTTLDQNRETENRYLEVHETTNHHDHCIFNNDLALAEIYNYDKPTIFAPSDFILKELQKKLQNSGLFKYKTINNKFLVPYEMDFKGVGIYIEKYEDVGSDFSHIILYLDTNDDVAVYRPTNITIFNCSTPNCKKLIPEIIEESSDDYLNKYLWANKISTIPTEIGENL